MSWRKLECPLYNTIADRSPYAKPGNAGHSGPLESFLSNRTTSIRVRLALCWVREPRLNVRAELAPECCHLLVSDAQIATI